MTAISVLFRCGHEAAVDPDKTASPICWCGERHIARTLNAPPPRIVGHARGPCVQTKHLGAIDVSALMRPAPPVVPPAVPAEDE